jgi:hypothetical protein
MSRRGILVGTGGLLIGASLPSFALGLTEQSAVTFIRKVVVDVNIVINSNKSETEILADFEGIFADYSANSLIAKTALGAAGRKVSQNQLAAYIANTGVSFATLQTPRSILSATATSEAKAYW